VSPKETIESLSALISKLEAQKTDLQTQLDSLPASLSPNHPTILMLKKSIQSVGQQIAQKRAELTSSARKTLNYTVDEFQRMEMKQVFVQDVYKTALSGLEKGRIDASRTLKKISVFQSPTTPNFPLDPNRPYNTLISLLLAGILAGVVKLLESIIRDHVD
jgi:capsular polysaccharide transport system permease protein